MRCAMGAVLGSSVSNKGRLRYRNIFGLISFQQVDRVRRETYVTVSAKSSLISLQNKTVYREGHIY